MSKKVLLVNGSKAYKDMFERYGWEVETVIMPQEPLGVDYSLIQFCGGADVSPHLYGATKHPTTFCNPEQDEYETLIFERYLETPKAGICRGGQFLNVLSGGSMIQDVNNHATHAGHLVWCKKSNKLVAVSSTHHQMMKPSKDAEVFLVCELSSRYENVSTIDGSPLGIDTEGCFYSKTNSLCYQPHPELLGFHDCTEHYFKMLNEFFNL